MSDDRWEYLERVSASDGGVEKLTAARQIVSSVSQSKDGRLAMLAAGDTTSPEVHVLENGKLRALTHHNDALLAELQAGRHRRIQL